MDKDQEIRDYVKDFTDHYVACLLWQATNDHGEPLDLDFEVEDIQDPEGEINIDCTEFVNDQWDDLMESGQSAEQSGHDFCLTRNGHGAGFWDRGLGDVGRRLTEASKAYGTQDLYIGDDQKLYIHN